MSPKMFTNDKLFTIQRLLFGDSTVLPILVPLGMKRVTLTAFCFEMADSLLRKNC